MSPERRLVHLSCDPGRPCWSELSPRLYEPLRGRIPKAVLAVRDAASDCPNAGSAIRTRARVCLACVEALG